MQIETDPTQLGRKSGDALQAILSIARKMESDISYLGAAMAAIRLDFEESYPKLTGWTRPRLK